MRIQVFTAGVGKLQGLAIGTVDIGEIGRVGKDMRHRQMVLGRDIHHERGGTEH